MAKTDTRRDMLIQACEESPDYADVDRRIIEAGVDMYLSIDRYFRSLNQPTEYRKPRGVPSTVAPTTHAFIASRRAHGETWQQIADQLNAKGIAPPTAKTPEWSFHAVRAQHRKMKDLT